jgi:diguanylate cyclase (GGDEF)-like protein
MSGANRTRLVLAVAVGVIALAVWVVSETQRSTAERVFDESHAAARMQTAMLDQETGLRGFALSRDRAYLQPFSDGTRDFDAAAAEASELAGEGEHRDRIDDAVRVATRWHELAVQDIGFIGAGTSADAGKQPPNTRYRKELFDTFRRQSDELQSVLDKDRHERLARAGLVSVAVIVLLALVFFAVGFYAIERQARQLHARRERDRLYRETQAEFAGAMQIMRDEAEAHTLVKTHLERTIDGADVTVLNRNNSDNRLYAATAVDGDPALAERLIDAEPESCMAVRLGHAHEQGGDVDPLLSCDLCGKSANDVLCTPSLVGGEVIGSVLVRNGRPLADDEHLRVSESVSQASPVLANLRNLAIAEARASTDALTGLPNSRSCRDNLKRMVAHAGRTVSPLSAVMFDLDHFKQINDRFGHGAGDDVLAAVGEVVGATLRGSDFGGRYGGEEFLVLLPGTDQTGALELAEKLRLAVAALEFQQPDLKVTASFGIATYPLDALDADALVRMADRALYAAKAQGRNRVELIQQGQAERDSEPEHQPQDA